MSPLTWYLSSALYLSAVPGITTVDLQPHTTAAFDRYIESAEQRLDRQAHSERFLWIDSNPAHKTRVAQGEAVSEPYSGNGDIDVPDGLIHDWVGAVFIPHASIERVIASAQDYNSHTAFYSPELQASKIVRKDGKTFDVYMRLLKKRVITVVLDTDHHVTYFPLEDARWYSVSHSTRIAEVSNPGDAAETEMTPGHDHGFLWRLNSYWHFEQRDGGVYVECEAISLSRSVPVGFGWLVNPIVRALPRESLANTLRAMRASVLAR